MASISLRLTRALRSAFTHDETDDGVLIRRARDGDTEAFGTLYVRYLDPIYRYIYFRMGEQSEAEDITEQVFLKAWEALPGYEQRGHPFSSWLYRIAGNMVVDYHRRAETVRLAEVADEVIMQEMPVNPAEQVIRREEMATLAKAIAQLPDEQQQTIILRFIEGLSHSEVADLLGKSEGACRALQYRALAALAQQLKRVGAE
ncbi:MAG: sigma-70 family RNA polymerase sigma factor [Chloroflexota bacterium]|nr:sigma-70 family RNA polymerase sigma factor [Chloroflexota bacterium]